MNFHLKPWTETIANTLRNSAWLFRFCCTLQKDIPAKMMQRAEVKYNLSDVFDSFDLDSGVLSNRCPRKRATLGQRGFHSRNSNTCLLTLYLYANCTSCGFVCLRLWLRTHGKVLLKGFPDAFLVKKIPLFWIFPDIVNLVGVVIFCDKKNLPKWFADRFDLGKKFRMLCQNLWVP